MELKYLTIGLLGFAFAQLSFATLPFSDPCAEQEVKLNKARVNYEKCVKDYTNSYSIDSKKCVAERTEYESSITELKECRSKGLLKGNQ